MAALTLRTVASTAVSKTATGSSGSPIITVSPDVFGIVVGHLVEGTGIAVSATVSSVNASTKQITLSVNNSGAVSGTVAFKEFTKGSPLTNQQIDDNFVEMRRELTLRAPLDNTTLSNVTVSSGTINGTSIGATTASSGAFTTLAANGATTLTANTASTSTTTGTLVVTGGVGVSGRVTADNFVGVGSGLTSLTAGNLSGTIPSGVLGNSSVFIGSTSVALNRATANLALTGITSVAFPGSSSGTATLQATAAAGTPTLSLPTATGTLVGTGDAGTVTNTMLAGSIANAKLANSSITVNGTAFSLGGTGTIAASTTNALTISTGLSGTSFNGSSAVTIAVDSTIARRADTTFIGTTSVALNRATANLALTGISSVALPGATSGTITLQPAATAGAGTVITLPATTGTVYVSGGTDVALADGGTNASLTAAAGGIVYSSASALAITAVGSAGQFLTSAGASAPTWTTLSFAGATSLPVENSAGAVQFTSTDSTGIQFAASGATTVAFDTGNQRVTFSSTDTNFYPTTFAWTAGTTAGPTGSLTGTGMSAVSYPAVPSASQTASGIITTGAQEIAGAKTFRASANQDAVTIQGRAGGGNAYAATITPGTLSGSRTITLPDSSGTVYVTGGTDVALADGGTNASLTAAAGGIVYSSASAFAISPVGSAGQVLTSGGAGAPTWSTISFSGATSLPIENSAGTVQFTSTDATGLQFAASGATSVVFDNANQRVTFSSTDSYPTTFAWTAGTTAGPTGSLTGSGMTAVSYPAVPSASVSASGIITTGAQEIAGAKTFRASANQDAVIIQGRAGGTGSHGVTLTPGTLSAARTLTLPDVTGTVVTTGDTGTVTSTMIANGTIVDADINASAAIAITKLAANTISGVSLGNNLASATFNNGGTGDASGTTYTGSTARTISYNTIGAAGTAAANTFVNAAGQAFVQTATQDGVIINGRAGGTTSLRVTVVPGTLSAARTLTLPDVTGTVVTTGDTGTVTNTMLAGSIANAKLTNSTVTVNSTAIALGGSATITANTTNTLTIGNGLSGSSFNGSAAITVAVSAANNTTAAAYYPVFATTQGTAVALGTQSALTYNPSTGVLASTDFNTTSDLSLKENIASVDGMALLADVNPVTFTWKNTGRKSYGVIAQEIEALLPELVEDQGNGIKGVSYIPLIALLIDAVKKLDARVQQLESK